MTDQGRQQHILSFLSEVEQLKNIDRAGYRYYGIPSPESVAEHSFATVWYVLVLAEEEEEVDRDKVIRMALLHDLAEIKLGDITEPAVEAYFQPGQKRLMERQAFADLVAKLPAALKAELVGLHEELLTAETKEALVVRNADKLQMLGQVLRYEALYRMRMDSFWQYAASLDWLPSARRYYEQMLTSREEAE